MKAARWKMLKWPLLAMLAITVVVICSGWMHGAGPMRGGHEAGINHGRAPFMGGGGHMERGGGAGHRTEGFPLVSVLLKVSVLMVGLALFAKGKSVLRWGGGLLAALALGSLLSFWVLALTALVIAAYWYLRKAKGRKQPERETAGAQWLNSQAHILDQWERQLDKEEKK